jgi:hypothetical protein
MLPETSSYIWSARVAWERRVRFELLALSEKEGRPLVALASDTVARHRASLSAEEAEQFDEEESDDVRRTIAERAAADAIEVRCVFTAEDLLDVMAALRNPNRAQHPWDVAATVTAATSTKGSNRAAPPPVPPPTAASSCWSLLHPLLSSPPLLDEWQRHFSFLSPQLRLVGLDDLPAGGGAAAAFLTERLRSGEAVVARVAAENFSAASLSALRAFARRGIPVALRPAMYALLLGVRLPLSAGDVACFARLSARGRRWTLLTDLLFLADVADGPADDEEAFIFREDIEAVGRALSQDDSLRERAAVLASTTTIAVRTTTATAARLRATAAAETNESAHVPNLAADNEPPRVLPPSGIIPSHRLSFLLSPLCFVYASRAEHWAVFRAAYAQHFLRLSLLSSNGSDSLLSLCARFEAALQWRAPRVVFRLQSLRVSPLQLAVRWLSTAFAGWLDTEQTLTLWDRLFAEASLGLTSLLAAAIFKDKEETLCRAKNEDEVRAVLRDIKSIRVLPTLQKFLFEES